jgi:molybdenum cofactor cytidylyltransferase
VSNQSRIAAVVLAAGMSRRMGALKALLPLGGEPIITRVVSTIEQVCSIDPIIVVTGYKADEIRRAMDHSVARCIHNAGFEAGGMLSSIQAGVRALANHCDGFFLVLGDQPLVRSETYRTLARSGFDKKTIILPTFNDKRGHPVLISMDGAQDILGLSCGATLKDFISAQKDHTIEVPVDDSAILDDIDTPEDYERALKNVNARRSEQYASA